MNQSEVFAEAAEIPVHLVKEVQGISLIYYLFKTTSGFHLKMEFGSDQFLTDWFPSGMTPFQLATYLFHLSVTPCTAQDVFDDLSCAAISAKTIYKTL